jgi:outer membrane biosynthesis protein TonB
MKNIETRINANNELRLTIDLDEVIGQTESGKDKIATTQRFERIEGTDYTIMCIVLKVPEKNKEKPAKREREHEASTAKKPKNKIKEEPKTQKKTNKKAEKPTAKKETRRPNRVTSKTIDALADF